MAETLPVLQFSHFEHAALIRAVVEDFAPRFVPDCVAIYVDDTRDDLEPSELALLADLGIDVDSRGKMPHVMLHSVEKNWLLLVEAVTNHGLIDDKRHAELTKLCAGSTAGLIFVTALPSRAIMADLPGEIAWETVVWTADEPSHLIHFNGARFLGPYKAP